MNFHHLGIATKDIKKTRKWIHRHFTIIHFSDIIYDPLQTAYLQLIETVDTVFELVSGSVVDNFINNNISYYHVCYEVESIEKSIESFEKSIVISPPKEAILFNNRKVAFLMTPIGIVELLSKH